jgi:hypothetical protein
MTVKYDSVMNTLTGMVETGFEDIFARKADTIQREVIKVQSRFFKRLVLKTIGRKSAPNLDEFTPSWAPLNSKYVDKKRKAGYTGGFFERTGELKTALRNLNPKTVLGTPTVLFTPSGLRGNIGTKARQEVWRGASSKRKVIRDSRGRFARSKDIRRRVTASISVDPYPRILENIANGIIDESTVFNDDIAKKLKNTSGTYRPLFTNFLNWFLQKEIRTVVEKASKI